MASSIAAFAVIALVVVVMPGADTIVVLRTSLRDGVGAGMVTASGVVCGPIIWGALAGLGAAALLSRSPVASRLVAVAGGVYLCSLAARALLSARSAWRSRGDGAPNGPDASPSGPRARSAFATGLMTNLLNPKIGVFYLSVMPGLFLADDITAWLGALLGTIHAVLGLVFLCGVAALSGTVGRRIARPAAQALIELACGLCLLAFAAFILVEAAIGPTV